MATDAAADVSSAGPLGLTDPAGDHYEDSTGVLGFFAGLPDTLRDFYEELGVGELLRGGADESPTALPAEPEPNPGGK